MTELEKLKKEIDHLIELVYLQGKYDGMEQMNKLVLG